MKFFINLNFNVERRQFNLGILACKHGQASLVAQEQFPSGLFLGRIVKRDIRGSSEALTVDAIWKTE